jgi:hypothetical protein
MSIKDPIDVDFSVVNQRRKFQMPKADDIEALANVLIGLGLLSVALYGLHLFLAKLV